MNIITAVIPIFTLIALGWLARSKGFMPPEFLGPANRLVYYLAIPAMIFRSISKASLAGSFHFDVIAVTLLAVLLIFGIGWLSALIAHIGRRQIATFVQSAFHGNLGYIGLAVSYYYLGNEGLARAGILAGFVMIVQNLLAVSVLQFYADDISFGRGRLVLKIIGNPVIVSSIAGMLFSLTGAQMPLIMGRSLDILSGMSLPLALLLIGASLSFASARHHFGIVFFSTAAKLILLPGIGFFIYRFFALPRQEYVPGLILLASPTATIVFIMAQEMSGDSDLAVSAISLSTLLSALTFSLWLNLT
ncbi:MAG: transporter [Desulfobacteraceae bacterium IS3]|nr:MAG: transporter [Desulfobacteraceae bacterium IS3]